MLIPSIDLQQGRVVQLVQGERLALVVDDVDRWIERFSSFPIVQLIDLDAARGEGENRGMVRDICTRLPCQVGGGIRTAADAFELIRAGARRVIVGSALFASDRVNVQAAQQLSAAIGEDRLVAAVDSRAGRIAVRGWTSTLHMTVVDAIAELEPWAGVFLATLIDGEGRMAGLDLDAAKTIRRATARQLIVAGGVRSLDEVREIERLGMDAVVGMAIYTGLLKLDEVSTR